MFGRNLREIRRKQMAATELRFMCLRYGRECGPVITYKLAPYEVDKIINDGKLLEDCTIVSVNGKSIKPTQLKILAKQEHEMRKRG